MSPPWKRLRGEELSAYAASIHAANQWSPFAKHLATHGTVEDFHHFIERDRKPVEKCLEVFPSNPVAALDWIQKYLTTPQSDPHNLSQSHLLVGKYVCEHMSSFEKQTADAIFEYINFDALTKFHKLDLFKPLVSSGMHHVVEKHWGAYKPLIENLMKSRLEGFVTFSAFFGFNLHDRINWCPLHYQKKQDLFVSCCIGGLVDELKYINISEEKHLLLIDAFCKTVNPIHRERSQNFESVLNYLWDTYPNTPWYEDGRVLQAIRHTSPQLTQKIVNCFQNNAPHILRIQGNILACKSLGEKNKDVFNAMVPFVGLDDLPEVVGTIIRHRQKFAVKTIVSLPNGDQMFAKTMTSYKGEDRQWAEHAYNTLQASRLKTTVKAQGVSTAKRKM